MIFLKDILGLWSYSQSIYSSIEITIHAFFTLFPTLFLSALFVFLLVTLCHSTYYLLTLIWVFYYNIDILTNERQLLEADEATKKAKAIEAAKACKAGGDILKINNSEKLWDSHLESKKALGVQTIVFELLLIIHNIVIHTIFSNNELSKNKHFLILLSSLARYTQDPKLKRIFEILWDLFEKSAILYFYWPKSWIWRTLEKVMNIFCKWHFHNASKEDF